MHEAKWYKQLKSGKVQCELCPHYCVISEGDYGKCNARKNVNGKLYSAVYGKPVSAAVDPIEKKPLYHFLPGSKTYSIGTVGCNLKCKFCQNWELSRAVPEDVDESEIAPEKIVEDAIRKGCKSIAYTYNDPIVFAEYVLEIARLARKKGLKNVFVSNGFINPEPLKELCKYIDAAPIDLKGFSEKFYSENCSARLKPVLEALKVMKKEGVWLEIINLIIPNLNDDFKLIKKMCEWIEKNLGKDTVLHFSRFFPYNEMGHLPITPIETLEKAREIALKAGLDYAYTGNVDVDDTYCLKCNVLMIKREHMSARLVSRKCKCGYILPGRF